MKLPFIVYEPLLPPSQTVAHQAIGDLQSEHFLFVDANDQGQGVPDLHVFRHLMPRWISAEDLHRASWHGSCCLSGTFVSCLLTILDRSLPSFHLEKSCNSLVNTRFLRFSSTNRLCLVFLWFLW